MTLLAALALLAPATHPDPKLLAPTADQVAVTRGLVRQLGSAAYQEREAATRHLLRLGRVALPALTEATVAAVDPEVRARVDLLLPKAAADERRARLEAFRADVDGRFDHALPGWDAMKARAGTTADARNLYADMWANKPTADLLAAADGPADRLARLLDARRAELYQAHVRFNPNGPRAVVKPADLAALLLLDAPPAAARLRLTLLLPGRLAAVVPLDGLGRRPVARGYNPTWYLLQQTSTRELVTDDARPAFRKLLAAWLDGRTEAGDLYQAMSLAGRFERPEMPPGRYASRLLAGPPVGTPPFYKMSALTILAKDGKPALPLLAKCLTDASATRVQVAGPNGQIAMYEVQVRDVALAMSVVAAGEEPEKYGFENASPGAARMSYTQYRFADDDKRAAAFKKWAERK